ncbi:MAG: translation elongation factor Ts [Candidatus Moranbacteria bacterium]|nr:translation elongation factor Ts [Candidatus Moranbacteria bacterium]
MIAKKNISAEHVKNLRDQTGASVMECKKALEKSGGDVEEAVKYLKKSGNEKAGKKASRATGEGVVAAYVHSNKKIGAMVELRCETDFVAKNSEFQELAYDIAMHVAAMGPKYLSFEKVSAKDKKDYEALIREELASRNKPADIIEKIVEGKVKKHFEEMALLNQIFVKNPDVTVGDMIKEKIAKIGENIQVERIERFEI